MAKSTEFAGAVQKSTFRRMCSLTEREIKRNGRRHLLVRLG